MVASITETSHVTYTNCTAGGLSAWSPQVCNSKRAVRKQWSRAPHLQSTQLLNLCCCGVKELALATSGIIDTNLMYGHQLWQPILKSRCTERILCHCHSFRLVSTSKKSTVEKPCSHKIWTHISCTVLLVAGEIRRVFLINVFEVQLHIHCPFARCRWQRDVMSD